MGDKIITDIYLIAIGIIGVAIVATVVSQQAKTTGIISASGTAFTNVLKAALSTVTGNQNSPMQNQLYQV